jgi:hypothetical protein
MTTQTKVIFKLEGKGKGKDAAPIAFFPEEPSSSDPWFCVCYAHIGQHSGADPHYAASLRPATPEQYEPLLRELKGQGYNDLRIMRKFNSNDYQTRKEKVKV